MKRAIHIFPIFAESLEIASIREKYDPLASKIAPHVTLVFPFEDLIDTEVIVSDVNSVTQRVSTFPIAFGVAEQGDEGDIWLPVVGGRREIIDLHDMLYSGPLSHHLSTLHSYSPHLTVARVMPALRPEALTAARGIGGKFESVVEAIVIERILPDESSQIIASIPLSKKTIFSDTE